MIHGAISSPTEAKVPRHTLPNAMPQAPRSGRAWFACMDCGARVGPLIRGSCEFCEPELHGLLRQACAAFDALARAYFTATGRPASDDWAAFDQWRRSRGRERRSWQ